MRRLLLGLLPLLLLMAGWAAHRPAADQAPPMRFAFIRQGDLWLWDAGQERRLARGPGIYEPRFSHDGRFIAYRQDQRLMVIRSDGTEPWLVTKGQDHQARWSPTANTLAISDPQQTLTVTVTDDGPQPPRPIAEGWSGAAWSPDGSRLAVARTEPGADRFEGTARVGVVPAAGGPVVEILAAPFSLDDECYGPASPAAWSPDGEWLLLRHPGRYPSLAADCNGWGVVRTRGGPERRLGVTPNLRWADWHPREPLLALTDGSGRDAYQNKQVKLVRPPWTDAATLTPEGFADREPAWSPGGSYLAFTRSRSEPPGDMLRPAPGQAVYVLAAPDGADPAPRMVPGSAGGFGPFWGRDSTLFWFRAAGGSIALYHGRDDLPSPLLTGLDLASSYYGQWDWPRVLDAWVPPPPYRRP